MSIAQRATIVVGTVLAARALTSAAFAAPPPFDAAKPYVLTPPASDAPRINPPRVVGVRPNALFLFRIPASGVRPMTYRAIGLPAGLALNPASGVITGIIAHAAKKAYQVSLAAINDKGTNAASLRIVVGDRIALTPPMGWNSWYVWSESVSEAHMRKAADAFVLHGLADCGWTYINIDDCWQGGRGGSHHAIQPNEKFPDIAGTVQYVHSLGLKAGIYSTPWVGTFSGFIGGSSLTTNGSYNGLPPSKRLQPGQVFGRYPQLFEFGAGRIGPYWFFDTDMQQIAEWGFDFIKVDWLSLDVATTERISSAVRGQKRDIVLSLSNSAALENAEHYAQLAELWRTTGDIADNWGSIADIGFNQTPWLKHAGPGHWNDPDMLQVGCVNTPNQQVTTSRPSNLTPSEQYSQVSLWSLLAAPLIISCDLEKLNAFTLGLLTNPEVIEVDQDPLGTPAAELPAMGALRVFRKQLEDGSAAIGIFNTNDTSWAMEQIAGAKLGAKPGSTFRDLWRQKDLVYGSGTIALEIPPHGVMLLNEHHESNKHLSVAD